MVILYHGILIILQIFLKKYLLSFFLPFQKRTILTVKSSDEHRYLHIDLLCPKLCTGFPQMVSETLYWQFFASNQLLITDGSPEKLSLNTGRKEMKQQDFMYSGLGERLKKEWKIYLAALIFIIIADSIGQIKIPLGPGTLILFPIFYSIFLGILSGPQILKIFKKPEVKAASKLVIVCICPFIAKLGINAGASIETVISAGPALLLQEFGNLGTIFLSLPIALLLGLKREAVGGCIGICGIAGFLLPMLYTGGLGFDVTYALALSFLAFLVSGIIGSFNYYKAGNLEVRMSLKLGIGSLIGAIAGVFLQSMIEKSTAKTILYLVVLFSGASILVRMWNEKRKAASAASNESPDSSEPVRSKSIADHMGFLIFLGITTGAICSLSGAGGPVLVMPLLVACGVSARIAVGVALFDSVFIAIPACIGYLSRITWTEVLGLLVLIVLTHGIGVWLGSRFAGKVPVQGLKIFVAVFSVCIAIYMLM